MAYEIKYRREDEMKDSGYYYGKPIDWEVIKIGLLFSVGRGRVISKEEIGDNKGEYPVYSSQTQNNGILGRINTFNFEGDYITWTTDGANAGTVFRRKGKFNCTNVCGTLKSKIEVDLTYASYMLSTITKKYVRIDINPKLMNNEMSEIRILYPKVWEQEKVANFLDLKTAEFDSIISKKELLIEKLEEAKKSLISEVVTGKVKIVDGELVERKADEMKDSGVEWLGMIPKDWKVKRLKHLIEVRNDKGKVDGNSKYIGLEHIESESGNYLPGNGYDNFIGSLGTLFYLEDVLFGKLRPYLAKCIIAPFDGVCSSEILVFNPVQINNKLLKYNLLNSDFVSIVNSSTYGAKMPRASWDFIGNIFLAYMDKEEQKKIVVYLDNVNNKIDNIITKTKLQIQKLKQAKQSLISEAVAGKIDLRDWEIQEI